MKKLLTLTAVGTVLVCSDALASGFNLKEQSAAAQGNAFAGATAGAEDISYSFFNPAGLTRHKGTKISVGGTWIAPRSRAKRAHADTVIPGDDFPGFQVRLYRRYCSFCRCAGDVYVQTAGRPFYPRPVAECSLWHDYQIQRSLGRPFSRTLSKVTTVTLTPMIAYKATDELSLGAGFQMQYIKATLRNGVRVPNPYTGGVLPGVEDKARLEGDTFDIGYQLGALYELTPQTRFGIGYRSQIKHKLKGDIEFDGLMRDLASQDISARLTTPANLTIGAYHDINDKWAVMGRVRTHLLVFSLEELRIKGDKGLDNVTQEKWKDTTFYSIGASYKVDDQWKLRAGFAVDQSAVGQEYRTPRIPDADRLWYSAGVEYKYDDKWTFNVGYTYIRADKGKVKLNGFHDGDTARGSLRADYENDIHILAASMNYNF